MIPLKHDLPLPIPDPTDLPRLINFIYFQYVSTDRMLVHNLPSGDPTPASAGIQMTHEIIEGFRGTQLRGFKRRSWVLPILC